ncbi:hypothetical protein AFLA_011583 [Aspergillus flavus NRRL3357]|nr:hypothetical protein AFLA_011583 [Aspergillus flavus NRRL3357]
MKRPAESPRQEEGSRASAGLRHSTSKQWMDLPVWVFLWALRERTRKRTAKSADGAPPVKIWFSISLVSPVRGV